jgi:hypothetical protein
MGKLTFEDARQYKLEKLEDALQEIASWTDAYPLEQFPEPDFAKVAKRWRQTVCVLAMLLRPICAMWLPAFRKLRRKR